MRKVAETLGMDYFDDSTYQANRMMYWPSVPVNGDFVFVENDAARSSPITICLNTPTAGLSLWPTSSASPR